MDNSRVNNGQSQEIKSVNRIAYISHGLIAKILVLLIGAIGTMSETKSIGQEVENLVKRETFKGQTLNVFNWSDYIEPELIKEYEKRSGATIQYDNYSTEGELETKLITSDVDYDVVFPSDKSMTPLVKKQLLSPIDKTLLTNLKYIDKKFLNPKFDKDNTFSVPYFWGTAAIGIRSDKVKEDVQGFEILFNKNYKGKITMLDDPENVVAVSMLHLGKKMNSISNEDLQSCEKLLLEQKELVQSYTSDSYKEKLISGEAWIALGWSGDLLQASKENKNIKVVVPKSGTMIWVDRIAISKGSKNKALAHDFINFLLDPVIAARNAEFVQYATPNQKALVYIQKETLDNQSIYPIKELLDKCEWLSDKGANIRKVEDLWERIK